MKPKVLFAAFAIAVVVARAALGATDVTADAPARVDNGVAEEALATIVLTPESERRLAIEVMAATLRPLAQSRLFAGHVIAPLESGGDISPVASAAGSSEMQRAEAQVAAEGAVAMSQAQVDGAKRTLERAERLLRDDAGSQRELDDARTQAAVAEAALAAARRQRSLLGSASRTGAGLWVRVPVHASDAGRIDLGRPARVGGVSGRASDGALLATPVSNPPAARSASPAIDFFYEVEDGDAGLRLGQQVGVTLPLRTASDAVVVAMSALLHDAAGGTWVYERIEKNTYARRRVEVASIVGEEAALRGDALAGREIVTAGAAELFGIEFGAGK